MTYTTLILFLGATVFDAAFARANEAYQSGDFPAAISGYEQLISDGIVAAPLFHNLGNAYYRTGQLGAAIANFERALQVDPDFAPSQYNLEHCVQQTHRRLGLPASRAWAQTLLFWDTHLSPLTAYRLAVVCWLCFWAILAVNLWKPIKGLRRAVVVFGFLAAAFGLSAYAKLNPPLIAVAVADHVPARYGAGEQESTRFELMLGDRVHVEERRPGWVRVNTASGERGWVDEADLALVGPPYTRPSIGRNEG